MVTTGTKKSFSVFYELAVEILKASTYPAAFGEFPEEVRSLEQEDYGGQLRRLFARSEVREIVAEDQEHCLAALERRIRKTGFAQ